MNFCETCGTKASESAMFCSSCGSALQEATNTSRTAPNQSNGKKLNIKTSLLATTSLMTAVLLGLVVLPNVFKPAELIKFEEIKLSVGESAYTWVGDYPKFKVVLQSKEAKYNDVALHLEKQDSKGSWSSVAVKEVFSPGVIGLTGEKSSKEVKAIYRASVFQGEHLVDSSEVKKVVFIPKKSTFTYVGRIGYRYLTKDEYERLICPTQSPCWGVYVHSRAKVRIDVTYLNSAAKAVSKSVKVDLSKINKVRLVRVPSIDGNARSGYFNHTEKLLTAKDLKRIALEWQKKQQQNKQQQQNKPTPSPTKTYIYEPSLPEKPEACSRIEADVKEAYWRRQTEGANYYNIDESSWAYKRYVYWSDKLDQYKREFELFQCGVWPLY